METEAAPYDARKVGNYILKLAIEMGHNLTQMSLLKIIFYSHGWYLALKGAPLFIKPVEAWEHGPVVKVVRDAFKKFGNKPINEFAEKINLQTGEFIPVGCSLSPDDEAFVYNIFSIYVEKTAFELSDMTHHTGGPWDKVWNSKSSVGRLG